MDFLKVAGAIASIITAIIAAIGIYPIFRSLKQSERSLRFGVYTQVLEMLEETREARHLLYDKVPTNPTMNSYSQLSDDELKQLDGLARTFDTIGLLVKHKTVPLEFVLDFY